MPVCVSLLPIRFFFLPKNPMTFSTKTYVINQYEYIHLYFMVNLIFKIVTLAMLYVYNLTTALILQTFSIHLKYNTMRVWDIVTQCHFK